MPSNHLILCHPLLLPSIFPSIRVFSNVSVVRIRWPKYWSFSFSISPSSEHSGLISFRMDWLDFLEVQGTLKSLFQLSHPYMTIGKIIALTRWTFVGKVMSLFFLICCLGLSWLPSMEQMYFNFMATVTVYSDFRHKKIKSVTVSTLSPSICRDMMGPDARILVL